MRWVFIALVLINASFLFVHLLEDEASRVQRGAATVPQGSQLQLLSELAELRLKGQEDKPVVEALCPMIGPFADEREGAEAVTFLKKAGYAAVLKVVQVPAPALTWVYIPPFPSWEAALAILRALQAEKVDSFIVTKDGGYRNAISLGYFENASSAKGLQAKLASAGYEVSVMEVERLNEELWVVTDQASMELDEGVSLRRFLETGGGLTLVEQACLSG